MKQPQFTDTEWNKRFDNQIMILERQHKVIVELYEHIKKMESKLINLEKRNDITVEVIQKLSERLSEKNVI